MRKFQEFVENKSLQLEQMQDVDPDDYDLGSQQKGDEREERWDWLIDQSKSYQDVLNRIRDLTKAYGKGGKWKIEPERLIPQIAELIDEVLPERPQYNFRSRK